jgi:hypothetical protein
LRVRAASAETQTCRIFAARLRLCGRPSHFALRRWRGCQTHFWSRRTPVEMSLAESLCTVHSINVTDFELAIHSQVLNGAHSLVDACVLVRQVTTILAPPAAGQHFSFRNIGVLLAIWYDHGPKSLNTWTSLRTRTSPNPSQFRNCIVS